MDIRSDCIVEWYSNYVLYFIAILKSEGLVIVIYMHQFSGTTVKYVLKQDKAAFIRLIGISVLQSAASSFIAPSLR